MPLLVEVEILVTCRNCAKQFYETIKVPMSASTRRREALQKVVDRCKYCNGVRPR